MMKWAFWTFLIFYILAAALLGISVYDLFGQPSDPLSAVFLLPLGLPWNIAASSVGISSPVNLLGAPLINLAILYLLWRRRPS
jgi:hypothetical protein